MTTEGRKERVNNLRVRVEKFRLGVKRMKEREQSVKPLKNVKSLEVLRLEGEALAERLERHIRYILKDSPYMLYYHDTGKKLY